MRREGLARLGMAHRAGVTTKTISEWLRGRGPLHPERIREAIERTEAPHRCQFLDFTAMVAEYTAMRKVVLALTGGPQERKRTELVLTEAQRLKKLDTDPK